MHIELSALGKKIQEIIRRNLITVQKHTTSENYYQMFYYTAKIQKCKNSVKF